MRNSVVYLAVLAAFGAVPAAAQDGSGLPLRDGLLSGPASHAPGVSLRAESNRAVGEVLITIDGNARVADGVSRVPVKVELRDREGKPLTTSATITIESTARVLLQGALTDETGPAALDRDRITPGVQLEVKDGAATFWLLSPARPQDVPLRVTAGEAVAEGLVTFDAELREMLAVGLVEGAIGWSRKKPAEIAPVRIEDGFEQEIREWSRKFSDDRGRAGLRGALFLKGRIKGDALLTLAYDSDKDTHKRLLDEIRGDEYYPVYGDSSVRAHDAQSASKLYVRIDKNRHYVLYGDFQTQPTFLPTLGQRMVAPLKLRDLGQYNRTLTGLRGHYELGENGERGFVNGFATRDTLKQVVEEYGANGTSGPFAVRNNTGVVGTETVEIVTRDRNNPAVLIAVEPLQRLVDYVFEPFSGRILLNRPVASRDGNGNPVSIRITYEVDQGGDSFWLFGFDGQVKLGSKFEVGGSLVEDKNPLAPYRLGSVNTGVRLGERTQLVAEVARSEGRYNTGNGVDTTLQPGLAGISGDAAGNAYRLAVEHDDDKTKVRAYAGRSDREFDNPAASFNGGRGDAGLRASRKVTDTVTVFGEAVRSTDRVADGSRTGAQAGAAVKVTETLTFDVALKRMEENGNPVGPLATLPGNPSSNVGTGNQALTPSGGFFGTGADTIDPNTGTIVLNPQAPVPASGSVAPLDATTLQVGARWQPALPWLFSAEFEHDVTGDDKRRASVGGSYRFAERSRLYAKWETQQGLASIYSLDPANKSTTFVFGSDTTYAPGAQFFSEYRLRDAASDALTTRDAMLASGLRNTWSVAPGVQYVTAAEYLRVLDGGGQQAIALAGGFDYSASALWKLNARLEWRRLEDDSRTPTFNEQQDTYLSTIAVARKLARDWTLLVRNYVLYTDFTDRGDRMQERFQIGAAYRDTDTNRVNALAKYEYKLERDASGLPTTLVGTSALPAWRHVHVGSLHADWHPSRPWWMTGRVAAKSVEEKFPEKDVPDRYTAWLLGGRLVYDVSENWDVGVQAFRLASPQGNARQYAVGVEVGYLVKTNLWASFGFNATGFQDRDLSGSDYTNQGIFLRLRFKFDENLLRGNDPDVNRTLDRPAPR